LQPVAPGLPFGGIVPREDLWEAAPAHVFDEYALLVVGRTTALLAEPSKKLNRGEINPALLLEGTLANSVLGTDAIVGGV
jgi:hypothetical protein